MKKIFGALFVASIFVPLFANAAWWNPVSWFSVIENFFTPRTEIVYVEVPATTTPIISTTTPATPTATTSETLSNNTTRTVPKPSQKVVTQEPKAPTTIPVVPTSASVPPVEIPAPTKQDFLNLASNFQNLFQQLNLIYTDDTANPPTSGIETDRFNLVKQLLPIIGADQQKIALFASDGGSQADLTSLQNDLNSLTGQWDSEEATYQATLQIEAQSTSAYNAAVQQNECNSEIAQVDMEINTVTASTSTPNKATVLANLQNEKIQDEVSCGMTPSSTY